MNYDLIQKIVQKDWYFQRFTILGFLIMGAISLVLIGIEGQWWFAAGSILLITVLITLGALLVSSTIVAERSAQTLPFLMSLPISMKEYTTAKILGNVLIFLVPWLTLVIASFVVITSRSSLPDGLVSYALLILTELFVNYCLLLAIALMTESQGWTTVGIVTGNLAFNAFLYYVSNLSAIRTVMLGSSIAWNSTFSTVLLLEVAVVIALLGFTFFVQFRKTDFV